MPRLRRLAPLLLAATSACVAGSDGAGDSTWEPCSSDGDCKDGRVCRSGACAYLEGTGGDGPSTDIARVLFRLSIDPGASAPVFIQASSEDRADAWLALYKGTGEVALPLAPTCMACFCGSCDSCGGLCGPAQPSVKRIAPGESVDLRWDGTTFPVDSTCPGDGPCYNIRPATEGQLYRTHFCWSLAATGIGEGQQLVAPIFCDDRTFVYSGSQAQLVEYRVTEGA